MIQNYDKFSRWNTKSSKIYTEKFNFIQQWLTCDLLGHLYVFFKTRSKIFHSKIISYEKMKND
jgi:hypothetical protein